MDYIQVKVKDIVLKPVDEVFDAIANPNKLSKFFVSRASSSIKENEKITWYFDDVGGELPVCIKRVIQDSFISFEWAASGSNAMVKIKFDSKDSDKTSIIITEESFQMDREGVNRALGQTQGWTDFICCMKAYLYCGINLREGRNKEI